MLDAYERHTKVDKCTNINMKVVGCMFHAIMVWGTVMAGSIIGIYQELFLFRNPVIRRNAIGLHRRNATHRKYSNIYFLHTALTREMLSLSAWTDHWDVVCIRTQRNFFRHIFSFSHFAPTNFFRYCLSYFVL